MSLKSSTSKDSIARDRSDSSDSKRTIKKERGGILGKLFGSNNSLKGSKSNIKEETEDEIVQLRHKKDYLSSSSYAHLNLSGVNLTQQSQSPSTSSSSLSTSPTQAKLADSSSSSRTTTTVDTSSYLSTSMAKNMYSLSSRNLEESMEIQGYDLHAEADELYSGKAARLAKKVITDPIFDYGASDYDLSSKKTKGTVEEDELRSSTGSNLSVKSNNSLDYDGPAVSYRDWDLEFQKLLQQKDELAKFQKLSNLGRDFIYTAKTYGRIIINELCLPYEHKSVKPKEVGGIAGGTKYIAQGILFKLVVDERKLYHGDHWAMKAASAELKGVMSYGNCKIPNLVTPLMALIDYRGFRLIAISLVNIDKTSLVYGSSDAGKTVAADDPVVNAKMKEAALKLNLKGHYVKDKLLYSAVDVEVHRHKELKDIYYVIDCARVMPPEAPSKTARIGSHLYNLLRPELVKSNQVPLSSDAFARFGKQDPNHKIHNKEVRDATSRLFDDVIPHFAKTLDNLNPKVLTNWLSTEKLHRAGINLRHLGLVRCKTVNPTAKTVLLTEIVARVLKNIIRKMFRDKLRDIQTPSEQPYYSLLLTFMNQNVLGNDCDFWTDTLKSHMIDQYQQSLSSEEIKHSFDIRSGIDWKRLINRFQDLTNIKFTKQANANLARYLPGSSFLLFEPDIKKIGVSVSHLSVIYHAEAKMLLLKAAMYENFERGETDWLWKLADNAFEAAIASSTDSQLTLCEWGSMLFKHSRKGSTGISNLSRSDQNLLIRAAEKYQIAHAISPLQDPNVLVEWVQVLCTLGWYHRSESDNEIYLQPLKASYDYEKISTVNGSVGERFYARGAYLLEIVIKQYLRDKELFKRDQLKVKYKTLLSFIKEITKEQQQSLGMFLHLLIRSETIKTFICSKFKKIDRLDLSNCGSHMRDAAIIESLKLSNFKKLIFQRCENVDDRLFLDISKYQLFVEHIDVSYCVRVLGGDHLSNLLNICGKLKSLTLVGCKIKEEELFQLAVKSKKKLDRMEISNSNVYNRCSAEGLKFVVCTQPQISFDLKSLIVSEEDVIINEQDITISDSDNNNLAFGKYQQKDVVIKTLLKKEDIIYTTEEQAKSVITRLFKIRDTKFIPILGMYLDKNAVKIVVERQRGVLLNTYLKETKDISFWMRMRIAYEIASACKWLFASKDFIIPKLKTTNVFLLLSENSSVKIGGIYSSDAVYKNLEISDRFLAERNTILEFASVLLDIFTPISHSSSGKIHIDPNEQKQYEDVKKLITDCKREDSRSRPSFDDLLNKFEDILFGTKSSHTNNRLLWESINKNWKVTWEVLWRQLMVIGSANFGGSKHRTYEGVLKKLLSSPDEDLLERFYKILYWFGPFEDVQHIIDKIIPLCKEPWFFGFVEESASFLSDCDKSTYFLVRFSQKQWGSYVVVINRPNNRIRSKVTQVRILPDKDNKLLIDDNHMKERKFATLADAIDYLRDKKLIESPCPGSPFQAFFNDSENKNDNANSEETYQLVSEFENYSFNIFNAEAMRQT